MGRLLCIGHGYTAARLAERVLARGWQVAGTTRRPEAMDAIAASGVEPLLWGPEVAGAIGAASHILISVPPEDGADPVLATFGAALALARPFWLGYLSTTAVYGDHGGAWVDETTPLTPTTARGKARVAAEVAWAATGLPLHIFRLAGIYGPGRGPFEKVRDGTARRIIKPGQVFSRIHVDDIAGALLASMGQPDPGAVYNLCDDDPAPPEDVLSHAAALLGLPAPPEVPYEAAEMSAMARSFYAENKRVRNDRMKRDLGYGLIYPDYRAGLRGLLG
ncbi:MAG: SDR family oxidoreductase [Paracoccaceae bacterium]